MKNLLIIGNGASRDSHKEYIDSWEDEIWACNQAYKEFGHRNNLTKIIGDNPTIPMILSWKEKNNSSVEVVTTYRVHQTLEPEYKAKTTILRCPESYHNDSGTSLVAEALTDCYDSVRVVGFDLGGKDLYVEGHEQLPKNVWVDRWRKLARDFTLDSIEFIGHDHKEFLLSDIPSDFYSKIYTRSGDHLNTSFPIEAFSEDYRNEKSVLILGNGSSRLKLKEKIISWEGEIWVCNWAFRETSDLHRISRVGSVHQEVIREAFQYKLDHNLEYRLHTSNIIGIEDIAEPFIDERGWSTGSLMIVQALKEGYSKIVLSGFDMGGDDIYQPTPRPGGNFKKQFDTISRENDMSRIFVLNELGEFPLLGVPNLENISPSELLRKNHINFSSIDKRVIILGNGSCVLEKEFGTYIDQFQTIVRLNDFVTTGYEKNIGSKTTCWISGAGVQTKIKGRDTNSFEESILLLSKERVSPPDEKGLKESVETALGISVNNFSIIPSEQILKIIELSGLRRPSTGICAILYFLHIREENFVVIHGFDFFQEGCHYYDEAGDVLISPQHDWEKEKSILEKYYKQGRVIYLKDLLHENTTCNDS